MAPSAIELPQNHQKPPDPRLKPTLYLLEEFPAAAIEYCRERFTVIDPSDPEVKHWRAHAESILVRELIITSDDIVNAKKLRAIGKQGTGIDIIDKEACEKRGIPILNTPGVNALSVAELVVALTMCVKRQLHSIAARQAAGSEVRKEHCLGSMISGRAIGVLGMGAIGTAVARIFYAGFGCHIYACDPFAPDDAWSDIPHTRVAHFEGMLPFVDMVTLHVPLNQETKGLVGAKQLRMMRPNAIIINVARGGIIVEEDLILALETGVIAGAGLDCHEEEPPVLRKYGRLWATGRVISTPHIGATTEETQVRTATAAMDNIYKYLSSSS